MTREFFNVIPWGKHKINAGDENKRLLINMMLWYSFKFERYWI